MDFLINIWKTRKIVVIAFVLLLILVAGHKNVKKENEIVFWTLQMNDFAPYINNVISDFERQYPDIKVKWVDVPFSEGEKRTLAAVLSNNPPDLVNLNPDFSALLAQRGALAEIDEKYSYKFQPQVIETLKYQDKLYSLPWYATSAITIYNKSLSEKVPETYEELAQMAPIIKEKTGVYAFFPNITENDTMLKILNKYGVNSAEQINSKKTVQVFDMYKKLYEQNLIPKETITQTHREALEKYMAGQIVFFQSGTNFLVQIKENAPEIFAQTDVAPQIKGDLGQNDFSVMNFVIPERAHHKQEALKFLMFLTSERNQLELAELTNVLVVNRAALKNRLYSQYDEDDIIAKARYISAQQLKKVSPAFVPARSQKEINLLVNTATQEILLGKGTTQEVLNQLAKDWSKLVH